MRAANLRAATSMQIMAKSLGLRHTAQRKMRRAAWGAQRGSWGGGQPGARDVGRAVDAACAAVHRWWPVRGGMGLASGGSAPESDGCECAEESFLWLISGFYFYRDPEATGEESGVD